MTGQTDLYVGPIWAACADRLRPPVPRDHVVERAWPAYEVWGTSLDRLPDLPLQWVRPGSRVAVAVTPDGASAAQCNVCGSPVTDLLRGSLATDPLRSRDLDLYEEDRCLSSHAFGSFFHKDPVVVAVPCGHDRHGTVPGVGLATVVTEGFASEPVVDWLYTWAGHYLLKPPGKVDPDNSPPHLFTPSATGPVGVLDGWQDDQETP